MLIVFIIALCAVSLAAPAFATLGRTVQMAFCGAILLAPSIALAANKTTIIGNAEVDGFKIGMTKAQIDRTRKDLKYGEDINGGGACIMAEVNNKPITLMLEKGVLTRIYFNDPTYATSKKIHIGSSEKQALAAYGKSLKVEHHKYDENGHYLTLQSKQGIATRFETDSKVVNSISIGTKTAIEYVEGCL